MRLFKTGLKFKILALIFSFITLSAIILIFNTYLKLTDDIYKKNEEVFQTFTNIFYSEKDIITKKYSMSLDILMENRPVLEAFKKRIETSCIPFFLNYFRADSSIFTTLSSSSFTFRLRQVSTEFTHLTGTVTTSRLSEKQYSQPTEKRI